MPDVRLVQNPGADNWAATVRWDDGLAFGCSSHLPAGASPVVRFDRQGDAVTLEIVSDDA